MAAALISPLVLWGTAQAALNRSKTYLQEREQFGEAIANFQALQF